MEMVLVLCILSNYDIYICTNFHVNFLNGLNYRANMFAIPVITKGHNSIQKYMELQFLFSDDALHLYQVCKNMNGFKVIEQTQFHSKNYKGA